MKDCFKDGHTKDNLSMVKIKFIDIDIIVSDAGLVHWSNFIDKMKKYIFELIPIVVLGVLLAIFEHFFVVPFPYHYYFYRIDLVVINFHNSFQA